jgi:Fructose-2,6-bisphosphatase
MKKSVFFLPLMALSVAFLAACSDDSSSGSNPDATDPGLSSSSIDMQAPTSSDITPTESSSSEVPEYVDPASLVPDEKGFVDIQLVYRSLQPNEKAVFAIRHAERDPSVTRESPLSEDGEEQALEVGRKLVGPDEFTYTHTDFVRTYKTCLNIATGRGQATFPNDTNDIFTESWFISNDSLYKEYSSQQNNSRVVIASWSYNGEFADAFYDYNEKNAEMVKMLAGDYATASRVRIVCSHDNFLVPLAVYLTNKAVDIKLFERNVWLNYLAGVAIITNDAGAQRFYAVKGLNSGVR